LDVHHLAIGNPVDMEDAVNRIAGVVTVGLFARRGADLLLVAGADGVRTMTPLR
jgi:ribose 5-phosphate isomerase A